MDATQYYNDLNKALVLVDGVIAETEAKATDEFAKVNYSKILNDLNKYRQLITKLLAVHRFMRLSKKGFMKNADQKTPKKIELEHTVKGFETPGKIAQAYNVSVESILKKNNITTETLTPGEVIKIEVENSETMQQVFEDIPTFGSQEGDLIYGHDVSNDLEVGEDGDLEILSNQATLAQGANNRLKTISGKYPLEPDFGIPEIAGTTLPQELLNGLLKLKIVAQFTADKRIREITDIQIEQDQNAINISGSMIAVNNKKLEVRKT